MEWNKRSMGTNRLVTALARQEDESHIWEVGAQNIVLETEPDSQNLN